MDASRFRGARRNRFLAACAAGVIAVLALAPRAAADGDERPATDAEKKLHAHVLDVFAKAIPPGPQGWAEERSAIEPPERVSTGSEKYPFRASYRAQWTDRRRRQEAEPKKLEALTKITNTPDPEWEALVRRNDQLAAEIGVAIGKGDKASVARISKELETIQKKLTAINAARDKRMEDALEQTTPRDTSLVVSLVANEFSAGFHRETAAEPSIAGGLVFRTKEAFNENSGWREGTTYVLLGKGWKHVKDGGNRAETKARPGAPSLAVQAIVVRVDADAARARAYLDKVDWPALKKLLAD